MSGTSVISKVFWPAHACTPRMRPGFIIGWNVRSFTACVAAVVSDVELSDLEAALSTFAADTHTAFAQMSKVCAVPPIVLGVFTGRGGKRAGGKAGVPEMFKSEAVTEKKQSANLWITIEMLDNYMPSLSSIYCCGFHYPHVPTEIIFYHQPNPTHLQYLSLEPLVLDVSPDVQPAEKPPQQGGQQQQQANERDVTTLRNMQRVMSHSRKVTGGGGGKEDAGDMEIVLNQINTSYYLEKGVSALLRRARRQRRRPFSDVLFDFLSALLGRLLLWCARVLWSPLLRPALVHPIMLVLFVVRFVAEVALFLLNVRLPKWAMNGVAIKDLSTAAQQVDLRLQQACYWPWQYMLLRRRNWANMATTRAQYISFYNSMWLVANDIIIGVAVGSFLINNSTYVAASLHYYLDHYMVDSLESMIDWLMGWPAGLKLNSELDKFLGELFLWLIRMWTVCMASLRPITPTLIGLIGLSGVCGASMIFSLASDLIAFMTLHVYWFYMVAARIFNWQLTILFSLFNLFQGKKRNMLRHRIDSCDYDLDQLLLGTILFTLLTFLFPTIIVYYLTFATSRVGVIFLQALMETLLAFLNHFPLFAIMLRFKDPERLPGGLRFEICTDDHFIIRHNPFLRLLRWMRSWLPAPRRAAPSMPAQQQRAMRAERVELEDDESTRTGQDEAGDEDIRVRRRGKARPISWASSSLGGWGDGSTMRVGVGVGVGIGMGPMSGGGKPTVCYLNMKNLPIPFGAIFFQYMLLWKRLSAHYLSLYVLRCLLYGEPIRPIPKLQYPMLPETRPSLTNFWLFLQVSFAIEDG